ncbi:MAG: PEP-CTERM sorting domain-containing protein [Sedimentisphaerales bacterium]
MKTKILKKLICVSIVLIMSSSIIAMPIEVGTGVNTAGVYIEWSDGFIAEFDINFGQSALDTITGADLLLTLDSELSDFTLAYTNWGSETAPDLFVDGIEYQGHINSGYSGGENWWHYWIKDAGESEWISPMYGMSSRTVHNGDVDGWIYGRGGAPIPEPTTTASLALGGLLLRRRRN